MAREWDMLRDLVDTEEIWSTGQTVAQDAWMCHAWPFSPAQQLGKEQGTGKGSQQGMSWSKGANMGPLFSSLTSLISENHHGSKWKFLLEKKKEALKHHLFQHYGSHSKEQASCVQVWGLVLCLRKNEKIFLAIAKKKQRHLENLSKYEKWILDVIKSILLLCR